MKPQTKFTYSAASTKLRKQARRGGLANFVTRIDCRALSQSDALPEMFSIGPSLKSQCSATTELLTTVPIQINRIAFHSRSNKNRTLESARTKPQIAQRKVSPRCVHRTAFRRTSVRSELASSLRKLIPETIPLAY